MNTQNRQAELHSLCRTLVRSGKLTEDKAHSLQQRAKDTESSLVNQLSKALPNKEVATAIAMEYGLSVVDLNGIDPLLIPRDILEQEQINKLRVLPLIRSGRRLIVAIADPVYLTNLDDVKFATGLIPEPVIVEYSKFERHLAKLRVGADMSTNDDDEVIEEKSSGLVVSEEAILQNLVINTRDLTKHDADEHAVSNFVDATLQHAISHGVSDIHIEPYEQDFRIRFRIDGILQVVGMPPAEMAQQIISRIKVMSRMDISERRVPQDGRIKFKAKGDKKIDFRVNSLPTLYGEKIVMRILDSSSAALGVDKLGFEPKQQEDYLNALSRPEGMILVTGPTGSGKTVTLYTGLGILNTPERNISTAEDPAEIQMAGVNQVNVNAKVGLTFAEALRSFLRQDPDIIMVGEVRDLETAEISVKAAQTGHLVLSTLHTNSAPETLTRLLNMGVPPFNIASSVRLIIAQRLARRLCKKCKTVSDIPHEALLREGFTEEEVEELNIYEAVGCDYCSKGYKGRVGVYQVMPISDVMAKLIMEGGNSLEIAEQAHHEGVWDIRQSGLDKVRQGVTSLVEINRITKD